VSIVPDSALSALSASQMICFGGKILAWWGSDIVCIGGLAFGSIINPLTDVLVVGSLVGLVKLDAIWRRTNYKQAIRGLWHGDKAACR
jgi:hypothetical protein